MSSFTKAISPYVLEEIEKSEAARITGNYLIGT